MQKAKAAKAAKWWSKTVPSHRYGIIGLGGPPYLGVTFTFAVDGSELNSGPVAQPG